jgi:predicted  nucleic acid-binding Zn-ribbon protein
MLKNWINKNVEKAKETVSTSLQNIQEELNKSVEKTKEAVTAPLQNVREELNKNIDKAKEVFLKSDELVDKRAQEIWGESISFSRLPTYEKMKMINEINSSSLSSDKRKKMLELLTQLDEQADWHKLVLINFPELGRKQLESILENFPRLTELSISDTDQINEQCIRLIAKYAPKLQVLSLNNLENLEHIRVDAGKEIINTISSSVVKMDVFEGVEFYQLAILNLTACIRLENINLIAPALITLNLEGCLSLKDIKLVTEKLAIQNLNLRNCKKINNELLRYLTEPMKGLKNIVLDECEGVTYQRIKQKVPYLCYAGVEGFMDYGKFYFNYQNFSDAYACYAAAYELDGQSVEALKGLINACIQQKQFKQAAAYIEEMSNINLQESIQILKYLVKIGIQETDKFELALFFLQQMDNLRLRIEAIKECEVHIPFLMQQNCYVHVLTLSTLHLNFSHETDLFLSSLKWLHEMGKFEEVNPQIIYYVQCYTRSVSSFTDLRTNVMKIIEWMNKNQKHADVKELCLVYLDMANVSKKESTQALKYLAEVYVEEEKDFELAFSSLSKISSIDLKEAAIACEQCIVFLRERNRYVHALILSTLHLNITDEINTFLSSLKWLHKIEKLKEVSLQIISDLEHYVFNAKIIANHEDYATSVPYFPNRSANVTKICEVYIPLLMQQNYYAYVLTLSTLHLNTSNEISTFLSSIEWLAAIGKLKEVSLQIVGDIERYAQAISFPNHRINVIKICEVYIPLLVQQNCYAYVLTLSMLHLNVSDEIDTFLSSLKWLHTVGKLEEISLQIISNIKQYAQSFVSSHNVRVNMVKIIEWMDQIQNYVIVKELCMTYLETANKLNTLLRIEGKKLEALQQESFDCKNSLSSLRMEVFHCERRIEELKQTQSTKTNEEKKQIKLIQTQISERTQMINQKNNYLKIKTEDIKEVFAEKHRLEFDIEKLKNKIAHSNTQLKEHQADITRIQKEYDASPSNIANHKKQIVLIQAQVSDLTQTLNQKTSTLKVSLENNACAEYLPESCHLKCEIGTLESNIHHLNTRLKEHQAGIWHTQQAYDASPTNIANHKKQITLLQAHLSELTQMLNQKTNTLKVTLENIGKDSAEKHQLECEIGTLKNEISHLNTQLKDHQTEIEDIQNTCTLLLKLPQNTLTTLNKHIESVSDKLKNNERQQATTANKVKEYEKQILEIEQERIKDLKQKCDARLAPKLHANSASISHVHIEHGNIVQHINNIGEEPANTLPDLTFRERLNLTSEQMLKVGNDASSYKYSGNQAFFPSPKPNLSIAHAKADENTMTAPVDSNQQSAPGASIARSTATEKMVTLTAGKEVGSAKIEDSNAKNIVTLAMSESVFSNSGDTLKNLFSFN